MIKIFGAIKTQQRGRPFVTAFLQAAADHNTDPLPWQPVMVDASAILRPKLETKTILNMPPDIESEGKTCHHFGFDQIRYGGK